MALTRDALFASPDHYLHSFDGDAAIFVAMDRAAYHRSIFLDGRIEPAGGSMRVPLPALTGAMPPARSTGWIFHVAHCGSTLLARALDRGRGNLVLREPLALRQLALAPDASRLPLVGTMLGKRYEEALATIVKANVPVNFLLPALAARDPQAAAILLYLDLPDYLLAILRSDNHRAWLHRVTSQLAGHLGDLSGRSDAERAATLWHVQLTRFADALAALPRARALDGERFFAEPAATLARAAPHLGVALDADEIAAIVAGPLFSTYSKSPDTPFDNVDRLARRQELEDTLAGEIVQAHDWLKGSGRDPAATLAPLRAAALV